MLNINSHVEKGPKCKDDLDEDAHIGKILEYRLNQSSPTTAQRIKKKCTNFSMGIGVKPDSDSGEEKERLFYL